MVLTLALILVVVVVRWWRGREGVQEEVQVDTNPVYQDYYTSEGERRSDTMEVVDANAMYQEVEVVVDDHTVFQEDGAVVRDRNTLYQEQELEDNTQKQEEQEEEEQNYYAHL